VKALLRVRDDDERLFAWRNGSGLRDVHAADVNEYLREIAGLDVTAKDFRTWHATVSAAVLLAKEKKHTKRVVAAVMKEVAEELGNTPAVARASYVDPRVVDRFRHGQTIPRPDSARPSVERQVRELLS
jgi:DNA topoisomerase-1